MFRMFMIAAACVFMASTASAQSKTGTAADAKAMLEKAVTAIKADKAKALDQINKGENGFLVGDIYPFCFNLSDGKIVAVASNNAKPNLGKDIRTLKDSTGKVYGPDIYAGAQKSGINESASYMFPRPGADATPVQKVSFVSAAGADIACGVGYYK
jgi:hypothetical protein